ncbi:MAG: peptidoglycan DD-metalloendopeptidase family protein [Eudoraea sp.]|nr:peptidoglycan DD-metalloendopeptidase family protein [Eudoraea sp.]
MRINRGFVCFILLLIGCKEDKPLPVELTSQTLPEEIIDEQYGFNLNDYEVVSDTIRYGDSFGELMLKNHADYPKILTITENYKDTFDVRKIRVGKPYVILKNKDSLPKAEVFIYENDRINYTVVDLRDSAVAYTNKKKVKYVEREASGVIETSLSDAILEQDIDYYITHELSEIYAWTIDFFRLQKGDKFKVIYKERYINDSLYAGAEPIESAYFEHNGQQLYAFAYESDSLKNVIDYFDNEANNLRRTFLRAPVKFSRISSRYNLKRRIRYYGYRIRPHKGTDYAAPVGTPILATADGVVTESTRKRGNGKYVKIRHNATYSTQYLHMRKQKVRRGDIVKQGDVIGWIGMTGNTAGPHVCYRFWRNGRQVDPLREELPKAEPLAETLRPEYFDFIEPKKFQLDCILYPEPIEDSGKLLSLNQ